MATYGQTTRLEIERIIKSCFHDPTDDELSFTVDSLWKELQIRVAMFLKWVGVCTMDPESEVPNLVPFFE